MSNKPVIPTVVNYDFASLYPSAIKSFAGSTNPDIRKLIRKYKLGKIFRSQA